MAMPVKVARKNAVESSQNGAERSASLAEVEGRGGSARAPAPGEARARGWGW